VRTCFRCKESKEDIAGSDYWVGLADPEQSTSGSANTPAQIQFVNTPKQVWLCNECWNGVGS
jgi:hypothetical protein